VYYVERVELGVVVLIEPGANAVIEPQTGAPRQGQGLDHELGDGLFLGRAGLIVEDVHFAVAALEHVDVAGEGGVGLDRDIKAELALHVGNVLRGENDRDFHSHGDGIGDEHEALDFVVTALVVGDGLEHQLSDAAGVVALSLDLDRVEIEGGFAR